MSIKYHEKISFDLRGAVSVVAILTTLRKLLFSEYVYISQAVKLADANRRHLENLGAGGNESKKRD